jgi:ubiquinone/menaquinone biosynthesis C-methylase UbiE
MNTYIPIEQVNERKVTEETRKRYNRISSVYDQMEWLIERYFFSKWRQLLWDNIRANNVLEIGVGTGKNIPYYPAASYVTAVDLSPGMMEKAKSRAQQSNREVDFRIMDVEDLEFPDNSFDASLATFVFCSVPDPVQGMKELGRVVKPGGDIWLLDHVRINKPVIGPLMDILNPLVVRIMGANINRQTVNNVDIAGLRILEVKNLMGSLVRLIRATPS